jgi:hypothetical protein
MFNATAFVAAGIPPRPPISSSVVEPAATAPAPADWPSSVARPGRVSINRAGGIGKKSPGASSKAPRSHCSTVSPLPSMPRRPELPTAPRWSLLKQVGSGSTSIADDPKRSA